MNALPWILFAVVILIFLAISLRNRRRVLAEEVIRTSRIDVGTDVMTTSGLYGTVVQRLDDGAVMLSIAPGVEVKWALAALRDAESLADTYRRGIDGADPAQSENLDGSAGAPQTGPSGGSQAGPVEGEAAGGELP